MKIQMFWSKNKQKVKEAMVWECLFYVIRICIHSLRPKPLISKSTEIQIFTKLFIVKSYINTDAYIKCHTYVLSQLFEI